MTKQANIDEKKKPSKSAGALAVRTQGTPDDLIRIAMNTGADLSKLKELLEIKKDWEANEARKAYHQAMADFKANAPKINKDKTVGYDGKQGGRVGYKHASLFNVTDKIGAELSKHGLSVSWIPTTPKNATKPDDPSVIQELISVTTRITHKLGHSEECTLSAPADVTGSKNAVQAIGSTVTYLQRYGVLSLTGLATYDQDDDGQGSTELINEKELSQLLDMIADTEANHDAFLKFMKIESLEKMPKSKFQQAMSALQEKKKGRK